MLFVPVCDPCFPEMTRFGPRSGVWMILVLSWISRNCYRRAGHVIELQNSRNVRTGKKVKSGILLPWSWFHDFTPRWWRWYLLCVCWKVSPCRVFVEYRMEFLCDLWSFVLLFVMVFYVNRAQQGSQPKTRDEQRNLTHRMERQVCTKWTKIESWKESCWCSMCSGLCLKSPVLSPRSKHRKERWNTSTHWSSTAVPFIAPSVCRNSFGILSMWVCWTSFPRNLFEFLCDRCETDVIDKGIECTKLCIKHPVFAPCAISYLEPSTIFRQISGQFLCCVVALCFRKPAWNVKRPKMTQNHSPVRGYARSRLHCGISVLVLSMSVCANGVLLLGEEVTHRWWKTIRYQCKVENCIGGSHHA